MNIGKALQVGQKKKSVPTFISCHAQWILSIHSLGVMDGSNHDALVLYSVRVPGAAVSRQSIETTWEPLVLATHQEWIMKEQ